MNRDNLIRIIRHTLGRVAIRLHLRTPATWNRPWPRDPDPRGEEYWDKLDNAVESVKFQKNAIETRLFPELEAERAFDNYCEETDAFRESIDWQELCRRLEIPPNSLMQPDTLLRMAKSHGIEIPRHGDLSS